MPIVRSRRQVSLTALLSAVTLALAFGWYVGIWTDYLLSTGGAATPSGGDEGLGGNEPSSPPTFTQPDEPDAWVPPLLLDLPPEAEMEVYVSAVMVNNPVEQSLLEERLTLEAFSPSVAHIYPEPLDEYALLLLWDIEGVRHAWADLVLYDIRYRAEVFKKYGRQELPEKVDVDLGESVEDLWRTLWSKAGEPHYSTYLDSLEETP